MSVDALTRFKESPLFPEPFHQIFSYLTLPDLGRVLRVNKNWNDTIKKDPKIWNCFFKWFKEFQWDEKREDYESLKVKVIQCKEDLLSSNPTTSATASVGLYSVGILSNQLTIEHIDRIPDPDEKNSVYYQLYSWHLECDRADLSEEPLRKMTPGVLKGIATYKLVLPCLLRDKIDKVEQYILDIGNQHETGAMLSMFTNYCIEKQCEEKALNVLLKKQDIRFSRVCAKILHSHFVSKGFYQSQLALEDAYSNKLHDSQEIRIGLAKYYTYMSRFDLAFDYASKVEHDYTQYSLIEELLKIIRERYLCKCSDTTQVEGLSLGTKLLDQTATQQLFMSFRKS